MEKQMNKYATPEIVPNVYAIGSRDWNRRIFDAIAPTPEGTTYNSYLIKGSEKTAVIDTMHEDFKDTWLGKIEQILGKIKLDLVIMNHAEPDHGGAIPTILKLCPDAKLVCSKKGAEMAAKFYHVSENRMMVVDDSTVIDLGDKTLKFIPAPFIHWPETMMTWLEEDKILFSCDFFGAHNTTGWYDDDAENVIWLARKYFAEIMMPLRKSGQAAMDKIKDLNIKLIAPSHGPIYKNPERIMPEYNKWTTGETKAKVLLLYVSMYHTTENMILAMAEPLLEKGIDVRIFDLVKTNIGDLAGHLLDTRAVVIGSPTIVGNPHPMIAYLAATLKTLKPPVKYAFVIGSKGWGGGGVSKAIKLLEETKIEIAGSIDTPGVPGDDGFDEVRKAGYDLADKILAG